MTNQKQINNKSKNKNNQMNISKVSHKVAEIKEKECRSNNLVDVAYRPSKPLPSGAQVLAKKNSSTSRTTILITTCAKSTNFKNL